MLPEQQSMHTQWCYGLLSYFYDMLSLEGIRAEAQFLQLRSLETGCDD
jgi:hypothetical protein